MGASFSTWQRSAGNHCNRAGPIRVPWAAEPIEWSGQAVADLPEWFVSIRWTGRMLALAANNGQVTALLSIDDLSCRRGGHPWHLTKRRDELGRAALTAQQLPTTQAVGHQVTLGVAHPFDGLHVRCPWP